MEEEKTSVTEKRIDKAIDLLDGKLKSDEDDYALVADIILFLAKKPYMSAQRAQEILLDAQMIVPYVSELKSL